MPSGHILVVDDEPDIRNLVKEILEDEGFEVSIADSGETARQARRMRRPDLILLDIWMDDVDGITLLREWSEGGSLPCPIIIMSGHATVETAVEATRLGAYDFIEKPISLAKLLLVVNRALESEKLQQENQGLRQQAQPVSEPAGRSEIMQALREQAKKIAQHNTWVLISGEPGSERKLRHAIFMLRVRCVTSRLSRLRSVPCRPNIRQQSCLAPKKVGALSMGAWNRLMVVPCCWAISPTWIYRPRHAC